MVRKAQAWETLIPWLIAVALLVLVLSYYFILRGKGEGALEFFKNLLKFR